MLSAYKYIYYSPETRYVTGNYERTPPNPSEKRAVGEDKERNHMRPMVAYFAPLMAHTAHNCSNHRVLATSAAHGSSDNFLGGEPGRHFLASFFAAIVNFPLWRAAAIGQSGFTLHGANVMERYLNALSPHTMPYRGVMATMLGMTWARAAIFYGSQTGKDTMKEQGYGASSSQLVPPLIISTLVQFMNMPLVRATVTIQNPKSEMHSVRAALVHIYNKSGVSGLWHGVSAGVLKTVPKYVVAVGVKDYLESTLPRQREGHRTKQGEMQRSAIKSISAGLAGAILTNPLDVLRNEMFKTDLSLGATYSKLIKEEGAAFVVRGMASNCTAVAIPIAITIFVTDVLNTLAKR